MNFKSVTTPISTPVHWFLANTRITESPCWTTQRLRIPNFRNVYVALADKPFYGLADGVWGFLFRYKTSRSALRQLRVPRRGSNEHADGTTHVARRHSTSETIPVINDNGAFCYACAPTSLDTRRQ